MAPSDRVCRECLRAHGGCNARCPEECRHYKPTCRTCIHKAPGRFVGMTGSPGIDESRFFGCELMAPCVGVQDRTRACRHYRAK